MRITLKRIKGEYIVTVNGTKITFTSMHEALECIGNLIKEVA